MTGHERFSALIETMQVLDGVSLGTEGTKRGFGSRALTTSGRIFAMLVNGRLVVKLPAHRVAALLESADGERLETGRGRLMKEWISIAPTSSQDWSSLALEAEGFVRGSGRS